MDKHQRNPDLIPVYLDGKLKFAEIGEKVPNMELSSELKKVQRQTLYNVRSIVDVNHSFTENPKAIRSFGFFILRLVSAARSSFSSAENGFSTVDKRGRLLQEQLNCFNNDRDSLALAFRYLTFSAFFTDESFKFPTDDAFATTSVKRYSQAYLLNLSCDLGLMQITEKNSDTWEQISRCLVGYAAYLENEMEKRKKEK